MNPIVFRVSGVRAVVKLSMGNFLSLHDAGCSMSPFSDWSDGFEIISVLSTGGLIIGADAQRARRRVVMYCVQKMCAWFAFSDIRTRFQPITTPPPPLA